MKRFRHVAFAWAIASWACGSTGDANKNDSLDDDKDQVGEALVFDFSGAIALALIDPSDIHSSPSRAVEPTAASNLRKIDEGGEQQDVLTSGTATITHFLSAPNGRIYLVFNAKTDLATSAIVDDGFILAEADPATGALVGIDADLQSIQWGGNDLGVRNSSIQFDADGAIYYAGITETGTSVLRRHDVETEDYINDNVQIYDFIVDPDGSVLMAGTTLSTNKSWIRKVSPTGGIAQILLADGGDPCTFMRRFPDGGVYVGFWGTANKFGTFILKSDNTFDERPWISGPVINELNYEPYNDITAYEPNGGFWGTQIKQFFQTSDDRLFAITADTNVLYQYYPTLSRPETVVTDVAVSQAVLDNLVLAGVDDTYANRLVMYDTSSETETELLSDYDIEVYRVQYLQAEDKILFDGLDFADNTYVLGQIDLAASNAVTLVPTAGNVKYLDLQSL